MGYFRDDMHPGAACIDCHSNPQKHGLFEKGPSTALAGTVYTLGHETDQCFGADGSATPITVEVTDASNKVFTMQVGPTGNFSLVGMGPKPAPTVAFPIKAKVKSAAGERVMYGSVDSGDCNSCHTVKGDNGAPGRIVAP